MATVSVTLRDVPFAVGASVGAYRAIDQVAKERVNGQAAPDGTVQETATVQTDSSLTFAALDKGHYIAATPIGGDEWQRLSFAAGFVVEATGSEAQENETITGKWQFANGAQSWEEPQEAEDVVRKSDLDAIAGIVEPPISVWSERFDGDGEVPLEGGERLQAAIDYATDTVIPGFQAEVTLNWRVLEIDVNEFQPQLQPNLRLMEGTFDRTGNAKYLPAALNGFLDMGPAGTLLPNLELIDLTFEGHRQEIPFAAGTTTAPIDVGDSLIEIGDWNGVEWRSDGNPGKALVGTSVYTYSSWTDNGDGTVTLTLAAPVAFGAAEQPSGVYATEGGFNSLSAVRIAADTVNGLTHDNVRVHGLTFHDWPGPQLALGGIHRFSVDDISSYNGRGLVILRSHCSRGNISDIRADYATDDIVALHSLSGAQTAAFGPCQEINISNVAGQTALLPDQARGANNSVVLNGCRHVNVSGLNFEGAGNPDFLANKANLQIHRARNTAGTLTYEPSDIEVSEFDFHDSSYFGVAIDSAMAADNIRIHHGTIRDTRHEAIAIGAGAGTIDDPDEPGDDLVRVEGRSIRVYEVMIERPNRADEPNVDAVRIGPDCDIDHLRLSFDYYDPEANCRHLVNTNDADVAGEVGPIRTDAGHYTGSVLNGASPLTLIQPPGTPAPAIGLSNISTQAVPDNTLMFAGFDTTDYDNGDGLSAVLTTVLTGTGAATAAGSTLTGTGTLFTSQLAVGDQILVVGETNARYVVTAIADDTHLTISGTFPNTVSGSAITRVSSRIVVAESGLYVVTARVTWTSDADGYRNLAIVKNNTTELFSVNWPAVNGVVTRQAITTRAEPLVANDFLKVRGQHTAGNPINISNTLCLFGAYKVSAI